MKKTLVFLSLMLAGVIAQADLGSAEIYLLKTDHSFDFLSVDSTGRIYLNNQASPSANLNDLLALDPQYAGFCFDGALAPLKNLVDGLAKNTSGSSLNALNPAQGRSIQADLTVMTEHGLISYKLEIKNCEF